VNNYVYSYGEAISYMHMICIIKLIGNSIKLFKLNHSAKWNMSFFFFVSNCIDRTDFVFIHRCVNDCTVESELSQTSNRNK
jgi:hypothetical protein